jgi:hypothetical protein
VLASLLDLPDTSSTKQAIAAVKAGIANIKRQLAQAKGKGTVSRNFSAAVAPFANSALHRPADDKREHG